MKDIRLILECATIFVHLSSIYTLQIGSNRSPSGCRALFNQASEMESWIDLVCKYRAHYLIYVDVFSCLVKVFIQYNHEWIK